MQDPGTRIQALLNRLVEEGRERGVQVTAYVNGQLAVDAWAGIADATTGCPVQGDTLFPVFSTTKGIAATLIHRLVEAGKLTYQTRIADVWPEFGAQGKGEITLDQALCHTCAIPYMPPGIELAELHDWSAMCEAIAQLKPAWTPGTRAEYHAVNYGWIVGEVAHRVDGRPFAQQVQEEICRPLGIKDLFVGIPDEVEPRVAVLEEIFDGPQNPPNPEEPQTVSPCMQPLHAWMNRPDARRACLPASNGIMNARSLALHYAALLPGGVDGVELLPPERVRRAIQFQGDVYPMRVGGYHFYGDYQEGRLPVFGHNGYGGSLGFADLQCGLAVGITKNLYSKEGAAGEIVAELRDALGMPL